MLDGHVEPASSGHFRNCLVKVKNIVVQINKKHDHNISLVSRLSCRNSFYPRY